MRDVKFFFHKGTGLTLLPGEPCWFSIDSCWDLENFKPLCFHWSLYFFNFLDQLIRSFTSINSFYWILKKKNFFCFAFDLAQCIFNRRAWEIEIFDQYQWYKLTENKFHLKMFYPWPLRGTKRRRVLWTSALLKLLRCHGYRKFNLKWLNVQDLKMGPKIFDLLCKCMLLCWNEVFFGLNRFIFGKQTLVFEGGLRLLYCSKLTAAEVM